MAYVETWDETKPAGSRDRSLGDDDIREFKRAIRERLNVSIIAPSDESGVSNLGAMRSMQMAIVETVKPTAAANTGWLYLKDVGGVVELFFEDESGNEVQLTSGGGRAVLSAVDDWRTDDLLHSFSTTTPTGWTDVTTTYNGKFLRVATGAAKTTGGADTHTHTDTLAAPAHTHLVSGNTGGVSFTGGLGSDTAGALDTKHQHSVSITSGGASATALTGSIDSGDNVPAYVQCKLYEKD